MRNTSLQPANAGSHVPPVRAIRQTLPCPVVPSPVQRLPKRSNARALVPGTPLAKDVASGGWASFGVSFQTMPPDAPSATYRLPAPSNVIPAGLQALGAGLFGMKPTIGWGGDEGPAALIFHTGHLSGAVARPVV